MKTPSRYIEVRDDLVRWQFIGVTRELSDLEMDYMKKLEEEYESYRNEWYFEKLETNIIKKGQWVRNMAGWMMRGGGGELFPAEIWCLIFEFMYDDLIYDNIQRKFEKVLDDMEGLAKWVKSYGGNEDDQAKLTFSVKLARSNPRPNSIEKFKEIYTYEVTLIMNMVRRYGVKMCAKCCEWFKYKHTCKNNI